MLGDRRRRGSLTDRLSLHLRTRTVVGRRLSAAVLELRQRRIPLHWTNMFGVVSLACFAVLLVTGVLLMAVYSPSSERVQYDGGYGPLRGVEVSKAFDSTMRISFEVSGGLLVRQAHHWAALLLPAALMVQLAVTFFTGAFRRPRQWSWVLLFLLFAGSLVGGWSGYALPDDLLAGTGLRIVEGIALGIPVLGTWGAMLLFGGEFPGRVLENLYPVHVAIVPVVMLLLGAARLGSSYRHKPLQFGGRGRTEDQIVGIPLLPSAVTRAGGLSAIVAGVILVMAATVTVSPIWRYGPSAPGDATAGSQPDWYTGFLDGALRLVPPGWEVEWLDRTWTLAVLVPLAVVSVFLGLVLIYPFVENWATGDRDEHHLLDRPRNVPTRTAIGVAGITLYGVLLAAASADVAAAELGLGIEQIITVLQAALVLGPPIAFTVARRVCLGLQRKDRELARHGVETGRIVRMPGGEYVEVHRPLDVDELARLFPKPNLTPYLPRPDEAGRLGALRLLRGGFSRFLSADQPRPLPTRDAAAPPSSALESAPHG